MLKEANAIFERVYQSYLMGGDTYSFYFKTEKEKEIEAYTKAVKKLESLGLVDLLFLSERKARMAITPEGISYGNDAI